MELFVLAKIADRLCALRALDVHSVIEIEQITPVPRAPAHICGLATRGSQALTVVDCRVAIGLPTAPETTDRRAAVVEHAAHTYALRVDEILDIAEAHGEPRKLTGGFGPNWTTAASGMIETESGPALVLDIAALCTGTENTQVAA